VNHYKMLFCRATASAPRSYRLELSCSRPLAESLRSFPGSRRASLDWGSDYYLRTGRMMPRGHEILQQEGFDAILWTVGRSRVA